MKTRRHVHEEVFPGVTPERLFAILHTPSAIRVWWGAARAIVIAEKGGSWSVAWGASEDEPDYTGHCTIREFDPPKKMVLADQLYRAKSGPLPFEADFVTAFEVEPAPGGARLRVTQDGFPCEEAADEFYAGCRVGWFNTFAGIRRFLGTG